MIDPDSAGTTGMPLRFVSRRDLLVRSAALRLTIHSTSAGTTGVPLRLCSSVSEGPACRVRYITFDNPFQFCGHDRRAPPTRVSEGPACQVRGITFDNPFHFCGHDRRAPPVVFIGVAWPKNLGRAVRIRLAVGQRFAKSDPPSKSVREGDAEQTAD
jgi:hypothetical protein